MHTEGKLKAIRLFLASPGGVESEREAVRRLIDGLNIPFGRHGWHIELLGWEDRGPASGRAQADINADVERCDIFLGVIWDRWGSPTGQYSSGFAEEWSIALGRWRSTGSPELWVCFKALQDNKSETDGQLEQVLSFRRELESEEVAFYKSFESLADLEDIVRNALLDEIFKRGGIGLTQAVRGSVDWNTALFRRPASLLHQGEEREKLSEEIAESDPEGSARLLLALASEIAALGFLELADDYRRRAAGALVTAGRHSDAITIWRQVVISGLDSTSPIEVESAAEQLASAIPFDRRWEADAWRACIDWPRDRDHAAERLSVALGRANGEIPTDARSLWRRTLWDLWLENGEPHLVAEAARELEGEPIDDDLRLLHAEAVGRSDPDEAGPLWAQLRSTSVEVAEIEPERSARISARWGVELARRGDWEDAEGAFARAASLWADSGGSEEESAECFFSAQAAAQISGDWNFQGWSWRPVVAALRGPSHTAAARAGRYEQSAISAHLGGKDRDARWELEIARAIRRRAGHLRGVLAATRTIANLDRDNGDMVDAAIGYCATGDSRAAIEAAGEKPSIALTNRLPISGSEWEVRSSIAALSRVGRFMTEERANAVLPVLLRSYDNDDSRGRQVETAEALSQVVLAVGPGQPLESAVERLREFLSSDNVGVSNAGEEGLRLLTETKRIDASVELIKAFAASPRWSDLWPEWVADRLDDNSALHVREAALGFEYGALLALGLAGKLTGDSELEATCVSICHSVAHSDLGRTKDGGIHGLLALDFIGAIASYCPLEALREEVAEKLLIYGLETYWPYVNRVRAIRGISAVGKSLDKDAFVDQVKPLAVPEEDLDQPVRFGLDWGGRPGELEAAAISSAVELLDGKSMPAWLKDAAVQARFDQRPTMRVAAWECAGKALDLSVDDALTLALSDAAHRFVLPLCGAGARGATRYRPWLSLSVSRVMTSRKYVAPRFRFSAVTKGKACAQ